MKEDRYLSPHLDYVKDLVLIQHSQKFRLVSVLDKANYNEGRICGFNVLPPSFGFVDKVVWNKILDIQKMKNKGEVEFNFDLFTNMTLDGKKHFRESKAVSGLNFWKEVKYKTLPLI